MRWFVLVLLTLIPPVLFAEPTTFFCHYDRVASPEGLDAAEDNFDLTFIMDGDKFYMVGSLGTVDITAIPGDGSVTFIEITATGNVMTTTITGTMKSVHSRNSVLLGDLIPSQYYGTCETK